MHKRLLILLGMVMLGTSGMLWSVSGVQSQETQAGEASNNVEVLATSQ